MSYDTFSQGRVVCASKLQACALERLWTEVGNSSYRWFIMKRPWDAILWWEKRRILFNLVVLAAGIVSGLIILGIGSRLAQPGEDVEEPLGIILGVIIYGIAANLCYTLGWVTELLWSWGDTQVTEANRSKVFRVGMIFSVALTLLPGILLPLMWAIWGFK